MILADTLSCAYTGRAGVLYHPAASTVPGIVAVSYPMCHVGTKVLGLGLGLVPAGYVLPQSMGGLKTSPQPGGRFLLYSDAVPVDSGVNEQHLASCF